MKNKVNNQTPKTEENKLTPLDYMLKVVNDDDSYIINKFGRLIEDYKYNDEGSWQNVNPFFVYSHISERYTEFKDYVFREILKHKSLYDKKAFLMLVENKLKAISWNNITIEDVLEPYGVTFIDLFENTNNKLAIVWEIKFDRNTILEIEKTNCKEEADRVFEQKYDVFHYILSYWRNKAIEFIRGQISDLSMETTKIAKDDNQNINKNVQNDDIENDLTDKEPETSHISTSRAQVPFESALNALNSDIKNKGSLVISKTKGFKFLLELKKFELDDILDNHHDLLVTAGYIDRCKTDFKAAYKGNKQFNKIIWKKSFPELQYYITKLNHKVNDDFIWVKASLIFLKNDGSEFTNRQLIKTKKYKGSIKSDTEIDEIFFDFYPTLDT